jgi:cytosine/adenosine deaminase-related metal-dependent hydrolase
VIGLVNAHTHVYSGLVPLGMPMPSPTPRDFPAVLSRIWWRLDRALDEPSLRASARYYVAHALLAGTTALVDHHESPAFIEGSLDVIADACEELGMRAALCYGGTERNGGPAEAMRGLQECRRFVDANRRQLVRGVVGLHASFTVSDETIREAGRLCRELDTVLHVHLAEDRSDVIDARQRGYAGPLERLLALDALPSGSILAHGVHLSSEQVARAIDAGCWIVQNPRSNRNNEVGYPAALGEAPRVALGTDGFPADMLEERKALFETGRARGEPESILDARCFGSLRLAAELFDADVPVLAPGADAQAFFARRRDDVRKLLEIDGRVIVADGVLRTADLAAITADATRESARLWARLPPDSL